MDGRETKPLQNKTKKGKMNFFSSSTDLDLLLLTSKSNEKAKTKRELSSYTGNGFFSHWGIGVKLHYKLAKKKDLNNNRYRTTHTEKKSTRQQHQKKQCRPPTRLRLLVTKTNINSPDRTSPLCSSHNNNNTTPSNTTRSNTINSSSSTTAGVRRPA
eukprot:PhM_4_TR1927/c0_g1_i2/m.3620